jgi:hypothetical protein
MWRTHSCVPRSHSCERFCVGANIPEPVATASPAESPGLTDGLQPAILHDEKAFSAPCLLDLTS